MTYSEIIDRYYPAEGVGSNPPLRDLYITHCRAVADYALRCAKEHNIDIDIERLEMCAMLHDIGIAACHAPSIHCFGAEPYLRHGIIGAEIIRRDYGAEFEDVARVCERHTGSGLTAEEIAAVDMPLPHLDYLPQTEIEQLVCYADKFFSKSAEYPDRPIPLDRVMAQMQRYGAGSASRFAVLHQKYSLG